MRKMIAWATLLLASVAVALAQGPQYQQVRYQNYAPTGACSQPNTLVNVSGGGNPGLYQCVNGAWAQYSTTTGTGNVSGTLATNKMPVAMGAHTLGDGHITDASSVLTASENFATSATLPQPPFTAINMWGDSLTAGNEDGSGITVCTLLTTLTGLTCNNYGVGGNTSTQILAHMTSVGVSPNTLNIVWACTNDEMISPCIGNMQAMVALVKAQSGAAYLLMGPLNQDLYVDHGPNGSTYAIIIGITQTLAALYPQNYIDIREQIVSQFNPASLGDNGSYAYDMSPVSQRAQQSGGTLTGGINASTCAITISSPPANFVADFTLVIDAEDIYVTTQSGGVVSACVRGYNQTTAASHSNGAAITTVDFVHPGGATGYTYVANQILNWMNSNPSITFNWLTPVTTAKALGTTNLNHIGSASTPSSVLRPYVFGTGATNQAFGQNALAQNYTGTNNTAIGASSAYQFNGNNLTAIGYQAAQGALSVANETAVGTAADSADVSGDDNTAVGFEAMESNTGNFNTAIGSETLFSNTSASDSTAIGAQALFHSTATSNTAVGFKAGFTLTTGTNEAFFGFEAGLLTTASSNTAMGSAALAAAAGASNSAFGQAALTADTGTFNSAFGQNALFGNTSGTQNTAVGYGAGYTGTSANANVSGTLNTWLGYLSGPGTTSQLTNATAIGNGALNSASNQAVLGNASVTDVFLGSTTAAANIHANKLVLAAARKGTFVCTSGGSILVANANYLITSDVVITMNTPGGTVTYAPNINAQSTGVSFTAGCATLDTSTYNYDILN